MSSRTEQLMEFLGKSEKAFGKGKVTVASKAKSIKMSRFSSGVFKLDEILGGGWPWGRMVMIHGPDRSGKSTLAQQACAQIQKLDSGTRQEGDSEEKCRALYVDMESVLDEKWAIAQGMNLDHHILARPESGEEAIDLVCAALLQVEDQDPLFDLIVLDSLAACTPSKELEGEAGQSHPGLQARLLNQAFRKWQPALTRLGPKAPTLLLINQQREKIGIMFGDPTTLPGGVAQLYYPSIRLRLSPVKMKDGDDKLTALATLKARTVKNKTYTQDIEAVFDLCVRDSEPYLKGQFLNAEDLFKSAKKFGICDRTWDTKSSHGEIKVSKGADMIEILRKTPELYALLRDQTLEEALS